MNRPMHWIEGQVDRIVGPTHHFGGLGIGNVASQAHHGQVSNPAAAALQGLDKMRLVASLGVPQWILPPQRRPDLGLLRALGFAGSDDELLRQARDESPTILSAAMSCSAMWTANAATVTPGCDGAYPESCLTVANLDASLHRAIEPLQTLVELQETFGNAVRIFDPLPGGAAMRDEGAANHMRLACNAGPGVHIFVYGDGKPRPERYWPRQSLAASQAVARRHGLRDEFTFFWKQHPRAIDAGAFHNDVVAMSDGDLMIHHDFAFAETHQAYSQLEQAFAKRTRRKLTRIEVDETSLSMDEAVNTYLFNSQILTVDREGESRVMLCPAEVAENANARRLVQRWRDDGHFSEIHFVDLRQSMHGGGGPACLRLRVPFPEDEVDSIAPHRRWSERLDGELRKTIRREYPTHVTLDDLARPDFVAQAIGARDRVAQILCP